MASFQAKIGWKTQRKREIKIFIAFRSVPTLRVIENSKKIAKKLKILNNTIIAPFQAKIGWKMQRKRENKNFHSVPFHFYPTRNRKFQKNSKKIQNVKKYYYGLISS